MSKIKIACPECATQYSVAESNVGKKARCKKCNARFVLTQTEEMDSSETNAAGVSEPQGSDYASEDDVPADWSRGDLILDRYEVRGVLGEGGMGRVYDVWHREWNKRLAVKSPRPDYFKTERQKENFTREAETWIDLGLHPHAVSCFYVRTLGGIPRVFAECIEGGDLKEWIDSKKLYEGGPEAALKRILDIAIQFAWGLGYAHEKNLIHQDVKPANVMLTPGGVAKVTDFGLAKARGEAGDGAPAGDGQSILASYGGMTPAYCSPEQANKETLTRRTDIWSWALSVLEMFIGEVTWTSGVAAPGVLEAFIEDGTEVDGLPLKPEGLAELLARCFELEEGNRPRSLGEVADQLLAVYRDAMGEEYWRRQPKAVDLQADILNNRGVSLWDLGKTEQAEAAFDKALKLNAHHPRAMINRGLLRWRDCRGTDAQILMQLNDIRSSRPDDWEAAYVLGLLHLERLDAKNAVENLEAAQQLGGGLKVQAALEQARQILPDALQCVRTFEGHEHAVTSVAFSPDGRFCLSGSDDETLRLWDVSTGQFVRTFEGHTLDVTSVAFSPDGRFCLSGSRDKTLRLWDVAAGQCLRTFFDGHNKGVDSVAFSPDGCLCFSGSPDETLRLWDASTGQCVRTFKGKTPPVAFSPDGRYCLSGSHHKTMRLWDVSLCCDKRHRIGAVLSKVSGFGEASLIDREFSELLDKTRQAHAAADHAAALEYLDQARNVPGRGSSEEVLNWNHSIGKRCMKRTFSRGWRKRMFEGHTGMVSSVAFSPDGRFCLSGSYDKTLRIWDVSTGQCLRTFEGHTGVVSSVAFSPDGRFCLSGNADAKLRLRVASTGRCVRTFEGHTEIVNSVAFSPDGRFCLSGNADAKLRLRVASTGQRVRTFAGHTSRVTSVAFSPDGRFCLSGSWDHTLQLWEFDWEYEFPGWSDWDEGATPYLQQFLTLHSRKRLLFGGARPKWRDADFQRLMTDLQHCGYGWLREEGVRKKLDEMTANWQGPPPLPGNE